MENGVSNNLKFFLLITLILATVGAQASSVMVDGAVWSVSSSASGNAVIGSVPLTPANITFSFTTTSALNFASGDDNSVYAFFESGGVPAGAFVGADMGFNDTITMFTVNNFTLAHNTPFTLGHDDGASFYINGNIFYTNPGPTSFQVNTFTYSGPTVTGGTLQIVYGECCGAPGYFETNLPTGGTTPEPGTLVMVGSGALGLVGVIRRKIKL